MVSAYVGLLSVVTLTWSGSLRGQVLYGSESDDYQRTASALAQYRVLAESDDAAILPSTKKPVEPGEHYSGAPRLIRLLVRIGDLPTDTSATASDLYQGALVTAVKRFQTRHGLEPDGRIGKATLVLATTLSSK
jgi:murein L,D-transpeptidase YcbB/YkuD